MKKKSQLQIMQSTVILLLVFVLFAIGLIFFFNYQSSKTKAKQAEYADLEMIKNAQMLNFFPELQCSFDNVIDTDCFDLDKIEVFKSISDTYYYKNLLGNVEIIILKHDLKNSAWYDGDDEIHPSLHWNGEQGVSIYDNSKPENKTTKIKSVNIPISLYEPKQDKYYFGLIKFKVYR